VEIQKPRQRYIDVRHFPKGDLLVDSAQGHQVVFVQ